MKRIFTFLFVSTLALTGFAQDSLSEKEESFRDKAFQILLSNIDHVKLVGDVKKGESLKPVFDDLGNLIANAFGSLFGSDDEDEEEKTNIKEFDATCSAKGLCHLMITDKSGIKSTYSFSVKINEQNEPTSIINNLVSVRKTPAVKK